MGGRNRWMGGVRRRIQERPRAGAIQVENRTDEEGELTGPSNRLDVGR